MGISLTHLLVIINYLKVQALKFFLESKLDKVMGCSVGSSGILFTIEPMIATEVVDLAARTQTGKQFH